MTWSGPPVAGDEVATLLGSLDRQRATFAWKAGGLDDAGMRATVGASTVTLAGLLKHLAWVEEVYFTYYLHGRRPAPPFDAVDWDAHPNWDWESAVDDSPEELVALWQASVTRARAAVEEAIAAGGMDVRTKARGWDREPNLRRMLVDMIEEYARHTGHADLIRESVDGLVGEDPPGEDVPPS